jgi:alpha-L-fucosidase 2
MTDDSLTLWYKKPAAKWNEALPLGNGHMGAMIYGGIGSERMELTENTCWAGGVSDNNSQKGACKVITAIREALFRHDYWNANKLAEKVIGLKQNFGTNLPFGNLRFEFSSLNGRISDYRRELQLENAAACVRFKAGDVEYRCEMFISNPHKVFVVRITAVGELDFTISLDGGANPCKVEVEGSDELVLNGHAFEDIHSDGKTGVALHARLRAAAGNGKVSPHDGKLRVETENNATLYIALGTDFDKKDPASFYRECIDKAVILGYNGLLSAHLEDYRRLFGRVELSLGGGLTENMATDERLEAVKDGGEDPSLTALMFQYGRYLLISSSREDSALPANLQGIWNDNIACRMGWTCDMHLDVNTEMNYWPAETANLSECGKPLYNWIENILMPSGKQTASSTYGLEGWVAHVVSNAWGYSAPGWAASWGMHPTGGIWVASQMWEHYLFTQDRAFLKEHLFPVYREAVKFFLKYLTKDKESGYYLSGPSMSPENSFMYDSNTSAECSLSMGAVCDTVLVRELLTSFISACRILHMNDELLEEVENMLEKLPPFKIGSHGQLQEWFYDFDEADPHHRHTSHLISVFPFGQITPDTTPKLAQAACVSIRKRTTPEWSWEDTAWARAFLLLYSARLHQPQQAYRHILAFQRRLTNINLLSFCPPGAGAVTDVFEMDGTTGFCAGIAEMLLQSHNGVIRLLPALPEQWSSGFIKGLCARGGFIVDMAWEAGKLCNASICSSFGGKCRIRYKDRELELTIYKGDRVSIQFFQEVRPPQ